MKTDLVGKITKQLILDKKETSLQPQVLSVLRANIFTTIRFKDHIFTASWKSLKNKLDDLLS